MGIQGTVGGTRQVPDLHGVTYGAMRWIAADLGVTVSSALLPHGITGLYRESDQRIVIDRSMTYRQKRCTLAHELMHWKHGDVSCSIGCSCRNEHRARMATAIALIDVDEYATVERMYEGQFCLIADALDVTHQVLSDWQSLLNDRLLESSTCF